MRYTTELEPAYRDALTERIEDFVNETPLHVQNDLRTRVQSIYAETTAKSRAISFDQAGALLEIMGISLYDFLTEVLNRDTEVFKNEAIMRYHARKRVRFPDGYRRDLAPLQPQLIAERYLPPVKIEWPSETAKNLCEFLDKHSDRELKRILNFASKFAVPICFAQDDEGLKTPTLRVFASINKLVISRTERLNMLSDASLPEDVRVKTVAAYKDKTRSTVLTLRALIALSPKIGISPWWTLGLNRVPLLAKTIEAEKIMTIYCFASDEEKKIIEHCEELVRGERT